jgi:polysaccharide biosynthesis transport protein
LPMRPTSPALARGLADARPSAAASARALGVPISAIEDLAQSLRAAGEGGRRVAVFGVSRHTGTTLTAATLARALGRGARVVLVDLALEAPGLAAISAEPHAPGIAEVVRGTASFADAITRDKLSRVHLVGAGQIGDADVTAIVASERVSTMMEALARNYEHVVIDAGAAPEAASERLSRVVRRAVLVIGDEAAPVTATARERLAASGFDEIALIEAAASATPAAA